VDFAEIYRRDQRKFLAGEFKVDPETGLMIHVDDFRAVLARIHYPVMAVFGEKDTNVAWRRTRKLYEETIGRNPAAELTVLTFPHGNHAATTGAQPGSCRPPGAGGTGQRFVAQRFHPFVNYHLPAQVMARADARGLRVLGQQGKGAYG
jgi:hypothetical protein